MKHRTASFWLDYIEDRLTESQREEAETHLYSCDHCLGLYMDAVERMELQPVLTGHEALDLTERIMADPVIQLPPPLPRLSKRRKVPERSRTVLHYLLAVCVTVLLMSTGVFQQLLSQTEALRMESNRTVLSQGSYSDQLMEKTTDLLDAWKDRRFTDSDQQMKDRGK